MAEKGGVDYEMLSGVGGRGMVGFISGIQARPLGLLGKAEWTGRDCHRCCDDSNVLVPLSPQASTCTSPPSACTRAR